MTTPCAPPRRSPATGWTTVKWTRVRKFAGLSDVDLFGVGTVHSHHAHGVGLRIISLNVGGASPPSIWKLAGFRVIGSPFPCRGDGSGPTSLTIRHAKNRPPPAGVLQPWSNSTDVSCDWPHTVIRHQGQPGGRVPPNAHPRSREACGGTVPLLRFLDLLDEVFDLPGFNTLGEGAWRTHAPIPNLKHAASARRTDEGVFPSHTQRKRQTRHRVCRAGRKWTHPGRTEANPRLRRPWRSP